jgi:hypothetical protein
VNTIPRTFFPRKANWSRRNRCGSKGKTLRLGTANRRPYPSKCSPRPVCTCRLSRTTRARSHTTLRRVRLALCTTELLSTLRASRCTLPDHNALLRMRRSWCCMRGTLAVGSRMLPRSFWCRRSRMSLHFLPSRPPLLSLRFLRPPRSRCFRRSLKFRRIRLFLLCRSTLMWRRSTFRRFLRVNRQFPTHFRPHRRFRSYRRWWKSLRAERSGRKRHMRRQARRSRERRESPCRSVV